MEDRYRYPAWEEDALEDAKAQLKAHYEKHKDITEFEERQRRFHETRQYLEDKVADARARLGAVLAPTPKEDPERQQELTEAIRAMFKKANEDGAKFQ